MVSCILYIDIDCLQGAEVVSLSCELPTFLLIIFDFIAGCRILKITKIDARPGLKGHFDQLLENVSDT